MDLLDPTLDLHQAAETADLETLRLALIDASASVAAAQARVAQALAVFRARGGDQAGSGFQSFGQWASVDLGLSSRGATALADAGDAVAALSEVRDAWESGALSTGKAQCLLRVADAASQHEWCALAREASATQLTRIAAAYRRSTSHDARAASEDQARDRETRCGAWWRTRDDDLVELLAVLTPDDAAVVRAALEAEMETQWRAEPRPVPSPGGETPPFRSSCTRRVDAVVSLAAGRLSNEPVPIVRGERTEVVLHVDHAFLTGTAASGRCHLTGGHALAPADARRLACDARVRAMLHGADGSAVDLGRSQRLVSDKQRRLLTARDHGCRFPGCGNTHYVDAHHVISWHDGGPTDLGNLILLCNRHHRLLHHDDFRIEADDTGGFSFLDRRGRPIRPPGVMARTRCPDTPDDPRARSGGDPRYSIDLAVTGLACAAGRVA